MPPDIGYLWMPLLACLVLTGIHAYLGIHVLSRGVIFVDLALAQIAALGATMALYLGMEPESSGSYLLSLAATLVAAALFSLTRLRRHVIPQEAIIGVVYAVAWAASVIVMAATENAHGVEKIQAILVGRSIVWVTGPTVLRTALVYAGVAAIHVVFRKQFFLASLDPDEARRRGMRLGLWDFLFYATFGVVITSSVHIAGVLLVFSFLIVPAVIGAMFAKSLMHRLAIGWGCGSLASFLGLLFSYRLPSGPLVVFTFGCLLVAATALWAWRYAEDRRDVLRRFAVAAALVGGTAVVVAVVPWRDLFAQPPHTAQSAAESSDLGALLASTKAGDRDRAVDLLRTHPAWPIPPGLLEATRRETDPDLETRLAEQGIRRGGLDFVAALVDHVLELESPFYEDDAVSVLGRYTDFPTGGGDAPVKERVGVWWQESRAKLRWDPGRGRFTR